MTIASAITLDSLPSQLTSQYERLCEETIDHERIEVRNSSTYTLTDPRLAAAFTMIKLQHESPQSKAPGKFSTDTVIVEITPHNDENAKIITDILKNMLIPTSRPGRVIPLFDKIIINRVPVRSLTLS